MLVDAGPLVSLCDRRQPNHLPCKVVLESSSVPMNVTWASFVEAMYLVGRIGGHPLQEYLWALRERGIIKIVSHTDGECRRMAELMERYQNVPMDLADASIVAAAEASGDRVVFTLDSDFRIYWLADGSTFEILPA
jgi:uncharacterized protein